MSISTKNNFIKGLKAVLSDDKSDKTKILNFNRIIDYIIESETHVCSSGCAWCCYQPVDVYPKEKLIINQYIIENLSQSEQDYIQEGANHYIDCFNTIYKENIKQYEQDAVQERATAYEYMLAIVTKKPIKCPFLSNDNTCLIYPVRPLMCRTHFVASNSEACTDNYFRPPSPQSRYMAISAHHILKEDNNHENPIALVQAIAEVIKLNNMGIYQRVVGK